MFYNAVYRCLRIDYVLVDSWFTCEVFLTTDTSLSFIKMVELYQIRWIVEVFNKEAKGLFNLGGCQSSNFDAQIADTTISMIAYMLLSFRFRYEHYESKGALYRSMNAECLRMTIDRRLWGLFVETVQVVAEILNMDADDLLERVLTHPDAEQLLNGFFENRLKEAG